MARVSSYSARFMSAELADKWRLLSEQQARAIERVILYGYLTDKHLVPVALLDDPDPICSRDTMYHGPRAWARQPAFLDALSHAKRLALMQHAQEVLEKSDAAQAKAVDELDALNRAEYDLALDPSVDAEVRRKTIAQARAYRDRRQYEADLLRRRGATDDTAAAGEATANWLEAARRTP